VLLSNKDIMEEIELNRKMTDHHAKEKAAIEVKFKTFIQRMNEDATLMLRDFEENTKAKEICRIMRGKPIFIIIHVNLFIEKSKEVPEVYESPMTL